MKRATAIILSFLFFAMVFVGCGNRKNGNVSTNENGMIDDNSANHSNSTKTPDEKNYSDMTKQRSATDDFMDDMKDATDDAGDMVQDIGRDINDAVDNNKSSKERSSDIE